jgi:tetratricopeptide (TPR) repeat protein
MTKHLILALGLILLMASCATSKQKGPVNIVFDDEGTQPAMDVGGRQSLIDFHEAMKAKAMGDIEKAGTLFKKVIKSNPDNDAAWFEMARIYYSNQDMNEAYFHADKAYKLDPENPYYLELTAQINIANGKYRDAIPAYIQLVDMAPGNADYYIQLASLYERSKDLRKAIAVYDRLENQLGPDEMVIIQKQRLYMFLGDTDKAVAEVLKLIELSPNEPRYYGILGETYEAAGMPEKAVAAYKQLLEKDPGNGYAAMSLADFYYRAGEQKEYQTYIVMAFEDPMLSIDYKVQHLVKYIDIIKLSETRRKDAFLLGEILVQVHPEDPKAYAMYGDLLYNGGKSDEALAQYEKGLEIDGSVFTVWQQAMFIAAELGKWEKLASLSEEAIALYPTQPMAYFMHGVGKAQLKEYEDAVAALQQALIISGSNKLLQAEIYAALGDTYHGMKEYGKSDEAYQESLDRNPDNAHVLNNFAYYLSLRKKELDKATEMARRANELEPNNAAFEDTYGWVLYQKGQYEQARIWIEKALKNGGDTRAAILEHYGDVHYQLGKVDSAVEYWQRALEHGGPEEELNKKIRNRKIHE